MRDIDSDLSDLSEFDVADVRLVESTVELLDCLLYFSAEEFVGAADHLIICHHIVVQSLLDDIFGYHAANFGRLV